MAVLPRARGSAASGGKDHKDQFCRSSPCVTGELEALPADPEAAGNHHQKRYTSHELKCTARAAATACRRPHRSLSVVLQPEKEELDDEAAHPCHHPCGS